MGTYGDLLKLMKDSLNNRLQQVLLNSLALKWLQIKAGESQRPILQSLK